jgi:hypothetical protein
MNWLSDLLFDAPASLDEMVPNGGQDLLPMVSVVLDPGGQAEALLLDDCLSMYE